MIRPATENDAPAIAAIYNPYILHTTITFEETPVTVEEMAARIRGVIEAGLPWLVMEQEGRVIGYAYAGKWKTRSAYRYAVESSIYFDPAFTGKGYGSLIYRALIEELKGHGIHIVIGGVTLPNPASTALHDSLGFTKVGVFREVGYKFDQWLDVGYWQLNL